MTVAQKIAALRREIAMRKTCYPRWVLKGSMKQDVADYEIEVMEAILADYEARLDTNPGVAK